MAIDPLTGFVRPRRLTNVISKELERTSASLLTCARMVSRVAIPIVEAVLGTRVEKDWHFRTC